MIQQKQRRVQVSNVFSIILWQVTMHNRLNVISNSKSRWRQLQWNKGVFLFWFVATCRKFAKVRLMVLFVVSLQILADESTTITIFKKRKTETTDKCYNIICVLLDTFAKRHASPNWVPKKIHIYNYVANICEVLISDIFNEIHIFFNSLNAHV